MQILILCLIAYIFVSAFLLVFHLLVGGVFGFLSLLAVSLALAALAYYWFRQWHERRKLLGHWPSKVTEPPSDLSAAAVCELLELADGTDEDDSRTPDTVVLEMVQKRTLGLIADGAEPAAPQEFTYRIMEQSGPKFVWEQAFCNALPQESLNRSEWRKRLIDLELNISQHLRKDLLDRGLLSQEYIDGKRNGSVRVEWLWCVLMWIAVVFSIVHLGVAWGVLWQGIVWWPGMAITGIVYVVALNKGCGNLWKVRAFTTGGRTEVVQWRRFGTYLESLEFGKLRTKYPDDTASLMPYAFALKRMDLWKRTSGISPIRREESADGSGGYLSNPVTVDLDDAVLIAAGLISSGEVDLDLDFDFEFEN